MCATPILVGKIPAIRYSNRIIKHSIKAVRFCSRYSNRTVMECPNTPIC